MPTIVSVMNLPLCSLCSINGDAVGCPGPCQMTTEQLCELYCLHVEMILGYFFNFAFNLSSLSPWLVHINFECWIVKSM